MKRTINFLISAMTMTVSVDALDVAYDFPPTTTTELVHGLCAMGFTSVTAESSFAPLTYDLVENFKDGERLWRTDTSSQLHRDFVGKGGFCEGGTYIQPSKHHAVPKGTRISVKGSTQPGVDTKLCYFVESDRNARAVNRDGGWKDLPGFEYVKRYQWDGNRLTDRYWKGENLGGSKAYCKTFENGDETSNVVRTAAIAGGREGVEVKFDFPPTTTTELVHGLCAMGFTSVTAESSFAPLTYDLVENFKDGERLWRTDTSSQLHRDFVGKGGFCEGGTYIQPSKHHAVPKGTRISVKGSTQPGVDTKLCYFVESDRNARAVNRDGGWKDLPGFEYVKRYQWDGNRLTDRYWKGENLGGSKVYCKTFENGDETSNVVRTAVIAEVAEYAFLEGIKLKALNGVSEYPPSAVTTVSQNTNTVSVMLRQSWGPSVDKYFYVYRSNAFNPRCFEEYQPEFDTVLDTITIQCQGLNPVARLNICVQDSTGRLLNPVDDDASVPSCCCSDPSDIPTPTVCYNLDIDCGDNTQRSLRGMRSSANDV